MRFKGGVNLADTEKVMREIASRVPKGVTRPPQLAAALWPLARGIANAWTDSVGGQAPRAYPELHHVTAARRAHGRAVWDPDLVKLWAATGRAHSRDLPAGDLVTALAAELRAAARTVSCAGGLRTTEKC